ncbi:MAG: ATP-binding protein [Mariprofundales bacterium]
MALACNRSRRLIHPWYRWLPLLAATAIWPLVVVMWPDAQDDAVAWVDAALLCVVALALTLYAARLAIYYPTRQAGSRLRAKLVIAMVAMLLVPAATIQIAANQMVGLGLSSWFDLRISALLDRALQLGQGFYGRMDNEMQQGLATAMNDDLLLEQAALLPISFAAFNARLMVLMQERSWNSLQVFDIDERMITEVRAQGLSTLSGNTLDDRARVSLRLGRVVTELLQQHQGEYMTGYAPLRAHHAVVGVLRASVRLPDSVVSNARAVEADYKKYRNLERHREKIGRTFAHAMMLVTLLVTLIAAVVATLFARKLTSPVEDLAAGFNQVAGGNLDVDLRHSPDDELGSLAKSFNSMTAILRDNIDALETSRNRTDAALRTSKQRQLILEMLLENLQAAVIIADGDGRIRLANGAANTLLLVEGSALPEQVKAIALMAAFFDELVRSGESQLQRQLELPPDANRALLARGVLLAGETVATRRYLLVVDDITALAESQRQQAWTEVARRLAHEIKNPLTPIKLATERLSRRFAAQVDRREVFDECTHTVIAQVERLQRLISDFSTMARMPQPRLARQDVAALMVDMAQLYRPYEQVRVMIPDETVFCDCDVDQVKQVLINLIDNALAESDKDQTVGLFSEVGDDRLSLHVTNEGEGIATEVAARLFEPYFSSKEGGSGLGLAIARRIAEDHGGELFIASLAHPTDFCLKLPLESDRMERT